MTKDCQGFVPKYGAAWRCFFCDQFKSKHSAEQIASGRRLASAMLDCKDFKAAYHDLLAVRARIGVMMLAAAALFYGTLWFFKVIP